MLFPRGEHAKIVEDTRLLRLAGSQHPLLLVIPEAGFYYLASGLHNPAPFDYPFVTAFGVSGEAAVAHQSGAGQIRQVCLRDLRGTPAEDLRPPLLENSIVENLVPVSELAACTLCAHP